MNHRKLSAGEVAGTYHITAPVTEAELLSITNAFARRRLARGRKISQPASVICFEELFLSTIDSQVSTPVKWSCGPWPATPLW